jgi:hypothetical protein
MMSEFRFFIATLSRTLSRTLPRTPHAHHTQTHVRSPVVRTVVRCGVPCGVLCGVRTSTTGRENKLRTKISLRNSYLFGLHVLFVCKDKYELSV